MLFQQIACLSKKQKRLNKLLICIATDRLRKGQSLQLRRARNLAKNFKQPESGVCRSIPKVNGELAKRTTFSSDYTLFSRF